MMSVLEHEVAEKVMEETSILVSGSESAHPYAEILSRSLKRALALDSKLPGWVLQIHGMSGRKYRRLVNNIIGDIVDARYLEIGSWAGSTACAAMFGNRTKVTCIDNWQEFGGPKDAFFAATDAARSPDVDFSFIESDFRKVDFGQLGKFNVYLFDGPHSYTDQYDGIWMAQPALESLYVQIVDDWNWPEVRNGTIDAMARHNCVSLFSIEVRTTQDDSHPVLAKMEHSDWHNGYYVGVVHRK
jgi:hypothetical protein